MGESIVDKSLDKYLREANINPETLAARYGVQDESLVRFQYSSKRKRMSTIITVTQKDAAIKKLLVKGASELII